MPGPQVLGKLRGHEEPDVVAAKHCQKLLGHFLEEAGSRVRATERSLKSEEKATWSLALTLVQP